MKVTAVYFSPTGNTKKSVEAMAGALDPNFTVIDVTAPEQASVEREFSSEELVIFGMPVYMGRIPAAAAPAAKASPNAWELLCSLKLVLMTKTFFDII